MNHTIFELMDDGSLIRSEYFTHDYAHINAALHAIELSDNYNLRGKTFAIIPTVRINMKGKIE